MLSALATVAEAAAFDIEVTDEALLRASTRIRAYVGQQITSGESTITVRGPLVRLPERPVVSVSSVLDWNGDAVTVADSSVAVAGWWLSGDVLRLPTSAEYTVTYEHGHATLSDEVVEFASTVAARIAGTLVSTGQELGFDAWRGQFGLTVEEKAIASRLFRKVPRTLVMRG